MNIEQDVVIVHGNWCLAQVADPRYLSRPTGAAERITSIMDQRRSDLKAGRAELCIGAAL